MTAALFLNTARDEFVFTDITTSYQGKNHIPMENAGGAVGIKHAMCTAVKHLLLFKVVG
jgi:hypothetical protein